MSEDIERGEAQPGKREWIGFWSLLVQLTQNAFNDKMAQFLLIPLGAAILVSVESYAVVLIALPFVMFAPLAGWVSDRFSKRAVVIGSAIFQLVVLVWITHEVMAHRIVGAMAGFFMLAVQSAFFGPAKIGLNKELLGTRNIGFASGIQQALSMLAILAGQIAAGVIFDQRWKQLGGTTDMAWQAALGPLIILTIAAVPAVFMGWLLPPLQAHSREPFRMSLLVGHLQDLKTLWADRLLRDSSFGVAFFWGFAAFINLWSLKLAKELTHGGEGFGSLSSLFMAAATVGMAAGFGAASMLQRKRIQLGWVPMSSILMLLCSLVLCLVPYGSANGYKQLMGINAGIAQGSVAVEVVFLAILLLLAFFAALFLAPLNAWMQDRYPADKRGEMQSAVNLQDCLAGIVAVAIIAGVGFVCAKAELTGLATMRWQMLLVTVLCVVTTVIALRLLTAEFLRVMVLPFVRLIYRIRVIGADHVPKEGGVLLLPNHVTWMDSFFISAACDRPVRFVMYDGFMKTRGVGWFARVFDTVPISATKAKDAIRVVAEALEQGSVVCLFAEGELTRTGVMQEIKRGFELMARKAGTPVIPLWMDGAWGSIFSFERGKFFKKMPYAVPYGMTFAFGKPIPADQATSENVRSALLAASATALKERCDRRGYMKREQPSSWCNGFQVGHILAIPRASHFAMWTEDDATGKLTTMRRFAEIFSNKVHEEKSNVLTSEIRVGGRKTRELLENSDSITSGVFYDFEPVPSWQKDGIDYCPCLQIDGAVIAMSMPHPPSGSATSAAQEGKRDGSVGLLLPGISVAGLHLSGPGLPASGVQLPDGARIDECGFVFLPD